MISEASRYYGAVLAYMIDELEGSTQIQRAYPNCPGFYVLNELVPIYIKYATRRHGPWTFSFQKDHQERHKNLFENYGHSVIAFVCGGDGIVALDYEELRNVLNDNFEQQKAISIRRKLNHMYGIKGRDGELERKISRKSLAILLQSKISLGVS
jgi:hypothetical protein